MNKPQEQAVHQLKDEIQTIINDIPPAVCELVIENFNERIARCCAASGSYLENLIFHA